MSRALTIGFLRSVGKHLRVKTNLRTPIYHPRYFFSVGSRLLLGSKICCSAVESEKRTKINIEDGLRKACEEGDVAIIQLLDKLKDFVLVISREYRSCLMKQIEITEVASNMGPLSDAWDELPCYRTLADELNKELNDYMTVFNAIGQMTDDNSLKSFVTGNSNELNTISIKFKELDTLLQKEIALNKETELKLLRINRDSILNSVTKDNCNK